MADGSDPPDEPTMDDLYDQLEELEQTVDTPEERKEVDDVRRTIQRLPGGRLTKRIDRYTTKDVAESFVGSILISLPMLVEDGVFNIADHFLENTVAGIPIWLVTNIVFVVALTWGLLYWAEFRTVLETNPFFGFSPRRLVGVLIISFLTATLTMTMWGRVGGWQEVDVALARIMVIWTAAAFGGALGDILPGESSGRSLRDVPEGITETIRSDD
jgi:uncharacterized membrane protein